MAIDWTMPMDLEDRAFLARTRQQFSDCCNEIAKQERNADTVAAAVAKHVAMTTTAVLPPSAQAIWIERVARPLRADATKALSERATGAIRSWPSARIGDLVTALTEIEAILVDTENDALHEAIYVEISRAYS